MDDETRPFASQEPSYEWDYGDEPGRPRVLWGRVIILGLFLLLAVLFGRWTSGGGGDEEQAQLIRTLQADLTDAQAEIAALEATLESPEATPDASPGTDEPSGEEQTYVVKEGDTLRGIAEKFYDDASLDDLIAEANGITDAGQLRIGDELIIPPKPE